MLSYRHSFHAGNHADVLKHLVLVNILEYLLHKPKALYAIDTHAGAGIYQLSDKHAQTTQEYRQGIGKLWQANDLPEPLENYLGYIRELNPAGELQRYPGSPWLIEHILRDDDKCFLCELHPDDYQRLRQLLPAARVQQQDGLAGLKALLPPPSRRAFVHIDPSYELKQDYQAVIKSLNEALKRFSNGVYMLWYPLLNQPEIKRLQKALQQLPCEKYLQLELEVAKHEQQHGMYGSGVFVINPPWQLKAQMQVCLPVLAELLGGAAGNFRMLEKGL